VELETLLGRFVLPLVAGGDVRVGDPVAPDALARWEVELGEAGPLLVAIDDARAAAAALLVVRPPAMAFGPAELRLAVALHAALVLAHPGTTGFFSRKGRRELGAFAVGLAQGTPPPTGPTELLERHTLLARLFELVRVDTHLRWWTGKAEFRGAEPPARLVRWRKLRRVRQETSELGLSEVLAGEETRPVVAALLAASPLTDLLTLDAPARRWPPFRWGPQHLEVLRDAELARAVAYRWLVDLGRAPADGPRLRAAAAASAAWEQTLATPLELLPRVRPLPGGALSPEALLRMTPLLSLPPRPAPPLASADVRAITAFLVYLNALCALAEAPGSEADGPSALVAASLAARRGPELGQPEATGLRLFFCVPDVAARCDPDLAEPPGLAGDPRVARRWAAHRAQVRAALGEERLAQLARRLAVCI
jgi:hypothetical protein